MNKISSVSKNSSLIWIYFIHIINHQNEEAKMQVRADIIWNL